MNHLEFTFEASQWERSFAKLAPGSTLDGVQFLAMMESESEENLEYALNLLDEMPSIQGVEAFRLNFTIESAGEVFDVIKKAKGKLNGTLEETLFNQETDTRGHFNKEII